MPETRRRGDELEAAILEAAWAELVDRGYSGMTFESVAERAQTSKPVLYRRWPTKEALMIAALGHRGIMRRREPEDTGTLRGDLIAALQNLNRIGDSMAGLLSTVLSSYYAETGTSLADMRARVFGDGQTGMQVIVQRAIDRGEIPAHGLTPRIISLPVDLCRNELLMTLAPISDATIVEIVDTIFFPLIRTVTAPD